MTRVEAVVVRGGVMKAVDLQANIEDVLRGLGRPGLCVMVAAGGTAQVRETSLVPHAQVCLSTERLLQAHGLHLGLEPTNELGNPNQFTLWLPPEDADTLVLMVQEAFRGPFVKKDLADAWTTDDLRGLQHPGP